MASMTGNNLEAIRDTVHRAGNFDTTPAFDNVWPSIGHQRGTDSSPVACNLAPLPFRAALDLLCRFLETEIAPRMIMTVNVGRPVAGPPPPRRSFDVGVTVWRLFDAPRDGWEGLLPLSCPDFFVPFLEHTVVGEPSNTAGRTPLPVRARVGEQRFGFRLPRLHGANWGARGPDLSV